MENITNILKQKEIDADSLWKITKYEKVIFKTQGCNSERHNVLNEEINKIALTLNDNQRIQSID